MEQSSENHNFTYKAHLTKVLSIRLINIFFSIITLGIYSFWGRNRLRRYFVNNVILMDKSFEYTGKGRELFLGFLKILLLYILLLLIPGLIVFLVFDPSMLNSSKLDYLKFEHMLVNPGKIAILIAFLYYAAVFYIVFVAQYIALRYRLSKTTFYAIRFKLTGSSLKYGIMSLLFLILNICSFFIFTPYFDLKLSSYKLNHTSFGSIKFSLKNTDAKKLLLVNIITLILAIPTLFLSRFWYAAAFVNHICRNLKIGDDVRVISNMTGLKTVIKLGFTLLLSIIILPIFFLVKTADKSDAAIISIIILFILAFVRAVFNHYIIKLLSENIIISGNIDLEKIKQADDQSGNSGEGILSFVGESIDL